MTRRIYWGIATLIILLIGVSAVLLLRNTDTEPVKVYRDVDPLKANDPSAKNLSETDKFNEWWEANKAMLVSDDSKQANDSNPDSQESNKFPDWQSLTPEQQQQIFDQFYVQFGLEVPPKGYDYVWKDAGIPHLDENGKPMLRRLDEPVIDIEYGIGFAPTLEEFKKYKEIDEAWGWAEARGDTSEAQRLKSELDALTASVQRMRPLFVSSTSTNSEQKSKSDRMAKEAMRKSLREYGLEHLISYGLWD